MTFPLASHREVDLVPVPSRVVATWPVGHFLENVVALPDRRFVVAVHNLRQLHRVEPDGAHRVWVALPSSPAGMVVTEDGIHVVAGDPGVGPHHLFHVGFDGTVADRGAIPDSSFLNGFTPGRPGFGYAVDSIGGLVIEIELASGASRVVLRHEFLTKISDEPMLPGANGIKATPSALFITNTDRALVLRAPLDREGRVTGELAVVAEHLRGDDLAIAADGDLFITTHIHNTVTRLTPEGRRTAVAGPQQGMSGCTACVFGMTPDTADRLFVVTTGGIVMPVDGVVQEARLVALDVGVTGHPVTFV